MRLRLVDLDGAFAGPDPFHGQPGGVCLVPVQEFGPSLRLWAGRSAVQQFGRMVAAGPQPEGRGPVATFLGSGDFHHLSTALVASHSGPLNLIVFDNHPDWVRFPPEFHCGSWINRALELPGVVRVVVVGPCGTDLDLPQLRGGNLGALAAGRLELYPWRHAPSRVFSRVGTGPGHRQEGGLLHWRQAAEEDWPMFWDELLARLSGDEVHVSIDKDVLDPAFAATNWDQGQMPLSALLFALGRIAERKRILGVDVVGDYTRPRMRGVAKKVSAFLDHPRRKPRPEAQAVNAATNAALWGLLREVA